MYKQLEYLRENDTFTVGGTYRKDLSDSGMLSALLLKIDGTCVSNATIEGGPWRMIDHISKIEVIANGATVIKSLNGKQAQFIDWKRLKKVPPAWWRNYATNTQQDYIWLLFGRKLWDTEYGLDLSRFDSVELRVTNSSSSTYHSAISIGVLQYYLRELPGAFRGFLRSEEFRSWTPVQNATEYLSLPTEFPIAGIYLWSLPAATNYVSDTGYANPMDDIDFKIGGGTKQVYKGGLDDLGISDYMDDAGEVMTAGHLFNHADYGADIGLGRPFGGAWGAGSKSGSGCSTVPTMEADPTLPTIKPEAFDGSDSIEFILRGVAYHQQVALHFSPNLTEDELLIPSRDGVMTLNIHTADSSSADAGTNAVTLERVVT
jgi:hypothetical protein